METYVWSVYFQSADSYHSVPQPPVAIFSNEQDAINYANIQPGYGYKKDWFVGSIPFNPWRSYDLEITEETS